MQRDLGKTYALDLQTLDQFFAKVQAGSRRRYRPFVLGVHRLVPLLIFLIRLALDIFRQRRFAQDLQHLTELVIGAVPQEPDRPSAAGGIVDHFRYQFVVVTEIKLVTHTDLPGWVDDHVPKPVWLVQFTQQENFDLGAGLLLTAIHSGGKYLGIIDYKNIFVIEIVENIAKMLV